jgi:aminoglycoside 6'-N-acetyltransferase
VGARVAGGAEPGTAGRALGLGAPGAAGLPILRGPRVALRPTTRRDILTLAAILLDPEVARWWPRYDAARVRAELVAAPGRDVWAIEVDPRVLSGSGRDPATAVTSDDAGPPAVVGAIHAWEQDDPGYRHAGIDLFLATAAQRRGLGPDAIRLVAAWLVDVRGHHRLTIDPAADNVAAVRAYRKVGFEPVGRLRAYERGLNGEWHDAVLMEMLAKDLAREG